MYPKVSIIITTFKGSNVIKKAVESVLQQTYENTEILVIDDNGVGTEEQIKTESIINEYFQDKVKYIAHKYNKNGSAARNTGIKEATGEYIALLDDDDFYCPDKIIKQIKRLQHKGKGYDVCYTGLRINYPNGKKEIQCQNDEGYIHIKVLKRKIHAPSSVLLFSKKVAEEIGGFDESFKRHQDWEFLDRLSKVTKVAVVSEPLVERIICKRNSASNATKYAENREYYLKKMESYFNVLSNNDKKEIYFFHYKNIAKEYLKEKKIKKALFYINMTKQRCRALFEILEDFFAYRKGNK